MSTCHICKRTLDDMDDPVRSTDCGGDCLQCMADAGDPDAIIAMSGIDDNYLPEAVYQGFWSRLHCGFCEDEFDVEGDVSNRERVVCDACGTDCVVSGR